MRVLKMTSIHGPHHSSDSDSSRRQYYIMVHDTDVLWRPMQTEPAARHDQGLHHNRRRTAQFASDVLQAGTCAADIFGPRMAAARVT
jgi:hypothetical protein